MSRRFRKLYVGCVFALSEKLSDALRRLLPAYDLCGGQVSCRVPIGDVDAVLGVPGRISAVFGDDAVAAVGVDQVAGLGAEAADQRRRRLDRRPAGGEIALSRPNSLLLLALYGIDAARASTAVACWASASAAPGSIAGVGFLAAIGWGSVFFMGSS